MLNIIRGHIQPTNYDIELCQNIQAMTTEVYKYVGVNQIQKKQQILKRELTTKFIKRMRKLLKTHINSKNILKASE